ncbi:Rhodanese-like domain-containing protein [Dactylonectria macrodidyma]|uniref:Rhodanese-like domain-containing protein n=1 Tax=Dactylonectria macrodidyma TaxID=307937 RepID=A0A9P9F6F1_9HYPO|nr:Rhodanese-like domain-containing protein [Dactylonectria macrodidyma]
MAKTITAHELRRHWASRHEIALLDVREEGPYAEAHPFFALTVPVSEVEHMLPALVPRLSAPIVVYDDGQGYTTRAVARILAMGYRDISILEGGLSGYALVGEVFRDVNVPSKAFGELVEAICHTPSLPAREIKHILENDEDVVVLDARRYEEYHTMSIPCGQSCPGGELLYRVFKAAPDPSTTVVVNCAGRTRSIVGTQSLVNAGIGNRVVALENGTIGWTLAGFDLEKGKVERVGPPSSEAVQKARQHAKTWARHVGVPIIDGNQLERFAASAEARTLYLLDVRDPREYAEGHPDGFISAPGGQLVQATDEWVGVRGARIVLYDTGGVRALITASWLLQLGWDVHVLQENVSPPDDLPRADQPTWRVPSSGAIAVDDLERLIDATIVDLARSPVYRKGHVPGAWFASGPELARDLKLVPGSGPIVLTSPDGIVAAMNLDHAREAVASSSREVLYLTGGTVAWKAADRPLETEQRWLSEPIDVYKRPYEGTKNTEKDMQAYIDWEHGLVAQVANDGIACFHVVRDDPVKRVPASDL